MTALPKGPNDPLAEKPKQDWPKWLTGPGGQRAIFQHPSEVPDGWLTQEELEELELDEEEEDESEDEEESEPEEGDEEDDEVEERTEQERADALVEANTQPQLVAMLEAMQKVDENIEFLASWPKPRLAKTIVENGGPLEA